MAISRMQQPRQMYGLGSFVKKAVRKVTKPFTKVAKKIVPKEVAGIMRVAAPFLPPGYREAAYLLGTAKQTGRISPIDLALTLAPSANQYFASDKTLPFGQRQGLFAEKLPGANKFLFGAPEISGTNVPLITRPGGELTGQMATIGAKDATTGIFGTGGKMFQFGKDQGGVLDNIKAFRDKTKLGSLLLEGDKGTFSPAKVAGLGVGVLSLIQNSKTADDAGKALAASTGDSADYDRGYALFSQLKPELFEVPEEFRMSVNVKDGGRIGFQRGTRPGDLARGNETDFFKDLFLERQGGGGRDFMIPERAADFKKYYKDDGGFGILDAPEGVNIFTSAEQAKKMNLDIAKELEAERIFPVLREKTREILDVVLDMPDSKEKTKILYDINHGALESAKQTDSGMSAIANADYNIIQKYGYLLNNREKGLGSMMPRKLTKADGGRIRFSEGGGKDMGLKVKETFFPDDEFLPKDYPLDFKKFMNELEFEKERKQREQLLEMFEKYMQGQRTPILEAKDGGIMRTNYARGSDDDDDKPVLPEDPTKPINPFGPKPIKPLGDMKMAGSDRYQRILEQLIDELEGRLGRELTNAEYDMVSKEAYDRLSDPDFAVGGRVNYALGTGPTAEESGLGGLPIEADMRYTGGFMPYGAKEKADDVPARLSKNEFVFTADAVRAAGGGSVNEGAKKMYATMKQLEAKPEAKGMTA